MQRNLTSSSSALWPNKEKVNFLLVKFKIKKINEWITKGTKDSNDSLDAIDETFDFPTDNDNYENNYEEQLVKTRSHQVATTGELDVSDIIQVRIYSS